MPLHKFHRSLLLAAFVVLSATSWAFALEILFPSPRTALTVGQATIVGKDEANATVAWQQFRSGDVVQGEAPVNAMGVFNFTVSLEPGVNRVTVGGNYLELYYDNGSQPMPRGYFKRYAHAGDLSVCEDCHDRYTGKLAGGGYPAVCTSCHVITSQNPKDEKDPLQYSHFKSVQSNCGSCHDAHMSESPKHVKADRQKPCATCHADKYAAEKSHPAFDEGGCAACHDTHYSGYDNNLNAPPPKICHQCHSQAKNVAAKSFHPPAGAERGNWCMQCHNPHETSKRLLTKSEKALCGGCHPKVLAGGHKDELSSCGDCHDPHQPLGSGLLKKDFKGCAECHGEYTKGKNIHTPVQKGCQSCHNPHVDDNVARARRMCLECHNFATDKDAASLHGNLPLQLPDCTSCHKVHSSDQPKLTRAKTHFPLTQGKCDACHGSGTSAARKIPKPNPACGKCHNTLRDLEKAKVHDPVGEGCPQCHDPHMSPQKAYLVKPMGTLCRDCHSIPKAEKGLVLHEAAETCTDCHAPHGGDKKKFLVAAMPKLCLGCHDDPVKGKKVIHAAIDEGCTSCHNPHVGKGKALLQNGGQPALCYGCHSDPTAKKKVVHAALDEGCTACHKAHAGDVKKLLAKPGNGVCLDCHDDPAKKGSVHPAIDEGCTSCHKPHAGDVKKLLAKPGNGVCLDCHGDPAKDKKVVHAALDEGCTSCHDAHASKNAPLLLKPVNKVCRDCHTDFKKHHVLDGKYAKDFPGPNPFPVSEGELSCVGCHAPHASNEGKLYAAPEKTLCSSCH